MTSPETVEDPAPDTVPSDEVDDGVWQRLDPRYVEVDRIGRWIFTGVVAVALFAQLLTSLFGSAFRVATSLAVDALLLALLAWWSYQWPAIAYRHASYRVDHQGIEIRRGVLWRRAVVVPKSRVQHTDVSQGPVQRAFGLGTLVVYTAGTDHAKIELPGLAHPRAMRIRDHLLPAGGDDAV
jgi:uncharacterized protein